MLDRYTTGPRYVSLMAYSLPFRPDKSSKDNGLCQTGIRLVHDQVKEVCIEYTAEQALSLSFLVWYNSQ